MERYQLARIIGWMGLFQSRKRMQKLIFLLQAAGCPLDAEYALLPHGPYSHDVALLTGQMTSLKLVEEMEETLSSGSSYSYSLTQGARRQLLEYESSPRGSGPASEMAKFESLARELYRADVDQLEIAATIVFYRKRGLDLETAVEKVRLFKKLPPDTAFLQRCRALAEKIVA